MGRRPLCVALMVVVLVILFFQKNIKSDSNVIYNGERKTFLCQIEEILGQEDSISLIVSDVMEEDHSFCKKIKVYQRDREHFFDNLKIGNIVEIKGEIYSFSKPGNPGQFNEYQYNKEQGIEYKFLLQSLIVKDNQSHWRSQWLYEVRSNFYNILMQCLPKEDAGVIAAMILGEKCALEEDVKKLYQDNGIGHILAISGLHISLIGAGLFYLLRRFIMPMKSAIFTTILLLLLYGELTGFSVSTKRAVIMMICMLMARFLGKHYDLPCALSLSAIVQLCLEPIALFQAGFLLSYGTVLGIYLFVGKFSGLIETENSIWKSFLGSVGVFLVTLPILLYFYYEINVYSAVVNMILLPFLSALLVMSIIGGVMAWVQLFMGRFFFGIVHAILSFYQWIGTIVLELPFAKIIVGKPQLWQIIVYFACLIVIRIFILKDIKQGKVRCKRCLCLLFLGIGILVWRAPEKEILTITNLDVGQGDCACLRYEDITMLVDGGSSDVEKVGKYRMVPFLKYNGVRQLDYIFLTHSDSDHVSGVLEILEDKRFMDLKIGTVVLPNITKEDKNFSSVEKLCKSRGVLVKKMNVGDCIQVDDLVIECLHPTREYEWQSENDYSLVLEVTYRDFKGIFTGDLEVSGEQEILDKVTDVDYLKVGHHGSKGSSDIEFLKKLQPEVAVISCSETNPYGHPHEETLKRLREVRSKILTTSEEGAITTEVGKNMEVRGWKMAEKKTK